MKGVPGVRRGVAKATPDSKVHGANMGSIWGRQDPGGPHVDPMNFAIWDIHFYFWQHFSSLFAKTSVKIF